MIVSPDPEAHAAERRIVAGVFARLAAGPEHQIVTVRGVTRGPNPAEFGFALADPALTGLPSGRRDHSRR